MLSVKDIKVPQAPQELPYLPMPIFCTIRDDANIEEYTEYNMIKNVFYTCTRKGWDMRSNGSEVYYIEDLKEWIPTSLLDIFKGVNPN
mgnify:FL=1